jgi:NitT/TauT family transport system ATP-binding protein
VLLSRRPSRVSSIVEPALSRALDPDAIRRDPTYIDTVESIWQELKHYLDEA